MQRGMEPLEIEVLDTETSPRNSVDEARQPQVTLIAGALIVVVAVAFALAYPAGSSTESEPPAPIALPTVTSTLPAPATTADPILVDAAEADAGPRPFVRGHPGPGVPILGSETDLALVYVNSLGRPTVVDLDTGNVREYETSSSQGVFQFVIEFGDIVTLDPEVHTLEPAGSRAVVFGLGRLGDPLGDRRGFVGDQMIGPDLCLTASGCSTRFETEARFGDGVDSVELLAAADRPDIAALFDPTAWVREARWAVAPRDLLEDYRIPAPLSTAIWLVHQPEV